MTTIDQLDIGIYIQYARRTQMVEQINQQYRFDQASSIPPQTAMVDLYPKLSEMDILLGVRPAYSPWAFFFPPTKFLSKRRGPFTFSRVIPSLGNEEEQEEQQENLNQHKTETEEEEEEKKTLRKCFDQVNELNEWLGFIVGRIGQFLQG